MNKDILIIGAGISGLFLAYKLKKEGFSVKVLEANNRIGGRIFTKKVGNTNIELGATWLWEYNRELWALCNELGVTFFEQNMNGDALFETNNSNLPQRLKIPENQQVSYRVVGGTIEILKRLANNLSIEELELNQKVIKISETDSRVKVLTENATFVTDTVVSTLPPHLLVNTIKLPSNLDKELLSIANNTHTWMRSSIKFAVIYNTPFWRETGLSGVGFSHIGPFTEIYDHSDNNDKTFALMGFLNQELTYKTKHERELLVKNQLLKFFGSEANQYLSYEEKLWSKEPLTNFNSNYNLMPHANNGHSIYRHRFLNGKFIVAGSETSSSYGGYMEGAIIRSKEVISQLQLK